MTLITSPDALKVSQIKQAENLGEHRDWLVKLLKCAKKAHDSISQEFLETVDNAQSVKEELNDIKVRNAELEDQLIEYEDQMKELHKEHGEEDPRETEDSSSKDAVIKELHEEKQAMYQTINSLEEISVLKTELERELASSVEEQ